MVHGTHRAYMPMVGGTLHTGRRRHLKGRGMGSVLLDGGMGGAGGGSSYSSIDDYIATTNHPSIGKKSLFSMNKKIEELLVKTNHKKEKNIKFNI